MFNVSQTDWLHNSGEVTEDDASVTVITYDEGVNNIKISGATFLNGAQVALARVPSDTVVYQLNIVSLTGSDIKEEVCIVIVI